MVPSGDTLHVHAVPWRASRSQNDALEAPESEVAVRDQPWIVIAANRNICPVIDIVREDVYHFFAISPGAGDNSATSSLGRLFTICCRAINSMDHRRLS